MENNNIERVELHERVINAYTEYAMSTIVDRALPDVRDGLLPVHRRILFSMYKGGMTYNKERPKSATPVSEAMKIHNHGDSSIYESLSLMTEGNETLLHPFIDGEGSFGKVYSTDSPSHMRYTFARLNKFSEEMFKDINKGVVKLVGEDGHYQPVVLPTLYPSILVKPNNAIAVGEACNWGSFRIEDVCKLTEEYIKNKDIDIIDYMLPDFSTGGYLLFDRKQLENIYRTGKGSITLRGKYKYDEKCNCIDIYEIPYSTTVERIIAEITKNLDKLKEVVDVRDETGFDSDKGKEWLRITLDLRKGSDPDYVMKKIATLTSFQCNFSYNMNCLVNYAPRVLGIKQILDEWLKFRKECIITTTKHDIDKKEKEIHLLIGLKAILLNIEKAVEIIRHSENPSQELQQYFKIDNSQAEYVLDIKLRNINHVYITKQVKDVDENVKSLEDLKANYEKDEYINDIIIKELRRIGSTYNKPRRTEILYEDNKNAGVLKKVVEEYNCTLALTDQFYIKKTLKQSDNHKLKDNDTIIDTIPSKNTDILLIFTDKANRYRIDVSELKLKKPSEYGDYMPSSIQLEENEKPIKIISVDKEAKGQMIFVFSNGKIAKVDIKSYISSNKKITKCYNQKSELVSIDYIEKDMPILMISSEGKGAIVNTARIATKLSRNSEGNVGQKIPEGIKCVFSKIGVELEDELFIKTRKGKERIVRLDDSFDNVSDKHWFKYLTTTNGNQGNFIYNCRSSSDEIVEVLYNIDK